MQLRDKSAITSETLMLDRQQASQLVGLGWQSMDKIARQIGARVTVGRRVLYNRKKLEQYFDLLSE
jgi:hypothetical protein